MLSPLYCATRRCLPSNQHGSVQSFDACRSQSMDAGTFASHQRRAAVFRITMTRDRRKSYCVGCGRRDESGSWSAIYYAWNGAFIITKVPGTASSGKLVTCDWPSNDTMAVIGPFRCTINPIRCRTHLNLGDSRSADRIAGSKRWLWLLIFFLKHVPMPYHRQDREV